MERSEIIVLCGGTSTERKISLDTGREVCAHLDPERWRACPAVIGADGRVAESPPEAGLEIDDIEAGGGRREELVSAMISWKKRGVACVFLALHGRLGEDGVVQGGLECAGLSYSASAVAASAVCMDKILTRAAVADLGCSLAPAMALQRRVFAADPAGLVAAVCDAGGTGLPCFVKPARGGSSLGLSRASNRDELMHALQAAFALDGRVLVERELRGIELSCGVLGNASDEELLVLEPTEIQPLRDGFFSYEEKYSRDGARELCPAESVPPEVIAQVRALSETIHRGLDLIAMSRIDFIAAPREIAVLEVNTIPGLAPRSILPRAAAVAGLDFRRLLTRILEDSMRAHASS